MLGADKPSTAMGGGKRQKAGTANPADMSELFITNMGPVPAGMTFLAATKALPLKAEINPQHNSGRLTLCETMREIWRIADRIGGRDGADLKALAAAGFHYGKCLDKRLKELKALLPNG